MRCSYKTFDCNSNKYISILHCFWTPTWQHSEGKPANLTGRQAFGELILINGFDTNQAVIVTHCFGGFDSCITRFPFFPKAWTCWYRAWSLKNVLEIYVFQRSGAAAEQEFVFGPQLERSDVGFSIGTFSLQNSPVSDVTGFVFTACWVRSLKFSAEEEPLLPGGVSPAMATPRSYTRTPPLCGCQWGHRWTWATAGPTASSLPRDTADCARKKPTLGPTKVDRWALWVMHVTGMMGKWFMQNSSVM